MTKVFLESKARPEFKAMPVLRVKKDRSVRKVLLDRREIREIKVCLVPKAQTARVGKLGHQDVMDLKVSKAPLVLKEIKATVVLSVLPGLLA